MSTAPIVEFDSVSKRYRNMRALSEVSFTLQPGEVLGYLGPNGAGKTTTLKILAGLLRNFDGEARILGHRLPDDLQIVHKHIGFLPQSVGFQDWRTADNALRSFGLLSGVDPSQIDARITAWLERFDLTAARHKKIKLLSGGMIQKLGLIQALLHEPELVILDEPLAGLDPASRRLVKEVVREQRAKGTTVMFSSHILNDVEDVADRIGIIRSGQLLTSANIEELRATLPVRVDIEFATPPSETNFLGQRADVDEATEQPGHHWRLRLVDGACPDTTVHEVIEGTLQRAGRIRRIGELAPDLDHLYSQYIETEAAPAAPMAEVGP